MHGAQQIGGSSDLLLPRSPREHDVGEQPGFILQKVEILSLPESLLVRRCSVSTSLRIAERTCPAPVPSFGGDIMDILADVKLPEARDSISAAAPMLTGTAHNSGPEAGALQPGVASSSRINEDSEGKKTEAFRLQNLPAISLLPFLGFQV